MASISKLENSKSKPWQVRIRRQGKSLVEYFRTKREASDFAANDHGWVATTPENERSLRGRQREEVGQTYGDSIPFANVTRDHCPEPRNASLQSAS